jgi:hypothetical protein
MLQSYATPSSVAQPTQGQRPAAHNFTSIPAQSQHWQANSAAFSEPQSTFQQQSSQPSVAQSTHGQHPAANDSRTAAPANVAAAPANLASQVPAQSQHWQVSGSPTVGGPSTFQPYAMASPVPVPEYGQLKVVKLAQLQLLMTLRPERSGACHRAAAQVPAQSQHWQASGLPTVEGPSTFQPYAVAPPVPVPVCGHFKVVNLPSLP